MNRCCLVRTGIGVAIVLVFGVDLAAQIISGMVGDQRGRVAPAGVITGVIVDDRGAPVARAMVQVLGELTLATGEKVEIGRSSLPTDESGRFRIDRLPPQAYLVVAVPPMSRPLGLYGSQPPPSDDQPVFGVTYFPSATSRSAAQAVTVAESGEQTIFIELRRVQPHHLRGAVVSPSGRSPAGLQIQLNQTLGSSGSVRAIGFVQPDGTFDVGGITPGRYTLMITVSPTDPNSEFAAADIQVADGDVDGISLALGAGGVVNGQIVFDGGTPGSAPLGATVGLAPVNGPIMARRSGPVPVAEDWTFQIRGLYGTYRFGLPQMLIAQYRPVRFEFDGRDLANMGFGGVEIRGGEHRLVIHLAPSDRR